VFVTQKTPPLIRSATHFPPRRTITFVIRGFTFVILLSRCVFLPFPLGARLGLWAFPGFVDTRFMLLG